MEKMDLVTNEEVKEIIRRKLNDGWIMLFGNIKSIENIERHVYPPRTPMNANFELITGMFNGHFTGIFLAMKCKELEDFMKITDYDATIAIEFMNNVGPAYLSEQFFKGKNHELGAAVDKFLELFFSV